MQFLNNRGQVFSAYMRKGVTKFRLMIASSSSLCLIR